MRTLEDHRGVVWEETERVESATLGHGLLGTLVPRPATLGDAVVISRSIDWLPTL